MKTISLLAALAGTFACTAALAQTQPQGQDGQRPHGPPAEAVRACEAKKAGAACSFTGPRGKAEGSCWAPEGRPLACRPKDAPAGPAGGGQPPQRN